MNAQVFIDTSVLTNHIKVFVNNYDVKRSSPMDTGGGEIFLREKAS